MKNSLTVIVVIIITIVAIIIGFRFWGGQQNEVSSNRYESEELGISFNYPANYFVVERETGTGERGQYHIIITEDTPMNRALVSGEIKGTEGPPTITIGVYQNNLDNYTTRSFIDGTSFSNFKLSDGKLTETQVSGELALRYRATGLYENENVVTARPNYVYMFTVFFNSPTDGIISDYEKVLQSVEFQ